MRTPGGIWSNLPMARQHVKSVSVDLDASKTRGECSLNDPTFQQHLENKSQDLSTMGLPLLPGATRVLQKHAASVEFSR